MTIHHIHTTRLIRAKHQCEAQRNHIHGRLVPMDRPEGEWPLWAGVALMFAMGVVGTLFAAAFGG